MGQSNSVCFLHADCCDGWSLLDDSDVNQTYAATHWYCYPEGQPPGWVNSSNFTNLSGIVFNAPIDYGFNLTEQVSLLNQLNAALKEFIYQYRSVPYRLGVISSSISIFIMIIAMTIYCTMLYYQPLIANRFSSRLWIGMIVADMIFSCAQLYEPKEDNWQCTTSAVLTVWSRLCSLFFSSAIGFNLLRVTVFEAVIGKIMTALYFFLPIVVSFAIIANPLFSGWFGFLELNCFFKVKMNKSDNFNEYYANKLRDLTWTYFNSWMLVGICLCSISLFLFYLKLMNQRKLRKKYEKTLASAKEDDLIYDPGNFSKFQLTKKMEITQKAAIRMSMFLFVPLLCSLPWAIMNANYNLGQSLGFSYFVTFATSLQGFFNSLIYLFDPSVVFCYEIFRGYLSEKFVLKYHHVDDTGKVSNEPIFPGKGLSIKWEKRAILGMRFSKPQRVSWPIVSYHVVKTLFTRKKDFVITKTGILVQNMEYDPTNAVKISAALEEAENSFRTEKEPTGAINHNNISPRIERNEDFHEESDILKNLDL